MPDGPGLPTTIGDGLRFIMAGGFTKTDMDGCGFPATNGLPPGLAGAVAEIIMDGRRWVPGVSVDIALSNYNPPSNYWNFVPRQYMGNPNWHNYYVGGNRNVTIINNTTIINNYSGTNRNRYAYAPGPDPNEVRRYSGNQFTQVQIREANTPGERMSGSQYVIYHPRVSATPAARGGTPEGRRRPLRPDMSLSITCVPSAQYQNIISRTTRHRRIIQRSVKIQDTIEPAYNQPVKIRGLKIRIIIRPRQIISRI